MTSDSTGPPHLYIVSGPDRAGKSTWIQTHKSEHDTVVHSGPIPADVPVMMGYHSEPVEEWIKRVKRAKDCSSRSSQISDCYLDRSYVCTHLLGSIRHQHTGHFDEVIDYELWLADLSQRMQFEILHVGLTPPWHAVAMRHQIELYREHHKAAGWSIRDQYITRMKEHQRYVDGLLHFYNNVTMFPHMLVGSGRVSGS